MSVKCGLKNTQASVLNPFGLISHKEENLPCSEAEVLECCPGKRPPPRVEEEFRFSHLHAIPLHYLKTDNQGFVKWALSMAKNRSETICSIQASYRETICG